MGMTNSDWKEAYNIVCSDRDAMKSAHGKAVARIRELEAELAEARRDGARLDHVINNFEDINFDGWLDHFDYQAADVDVKGGRGGGVEFLKAWRKYLDAEMEGKSDDKG